MKADVSFVHVDISWQLPEPSATEAGPDQQASTRDQQTNDHQQFAHLWHTELYTHQGALAMGQQNAKRRSILRR